MEKIRKKRGQEPKDRPGAAAQAAQEDDGGDEEAVA
jgi:hypothetical protein